MHTMSRFKIFKKLSIKLFSQWTRCNFNKCGTHYEFMVQIIKNYILKKKRVRRKPWMKAERTSSQQNPGYSVRRDKLPRN